MLALKLDATKSTPTILFDPHAGLLSIRGESYPENAAKHYAPLFEALQAFLAAPGAQPLTVDLELIYINSSSSKIFFNLFELLEGAGRAGRQVTVNWRYQAENDTAQTCGEEFQEEARAIAFHVVEIP